MALVNHDTHRNGTLYVYDHYRDGKQVKSVYLGRADDVNVVSSIPAKGYPVEAKCYKEGHQAGIQAEKDVYGKERYKELNNHINKVVPKGELAGSHTEDGKILVHKNIDEKYHKQIITHERAEHEYMQSCEVEYGGHRHDKGDPEWKHNHPQYEHQGAKPRTQQISDRRIESCLRHKDELGAGAKKRREMNLTKEEHVKCVLAEYERGTLHSSSGKKVTSKKQALAIAYSEIREKEK